MSDTAEVPEVEPEPLVPLERTTSGRRGGPSRRRTALVVLPLLAGLAVAGGVGGRLLLHTGDDATTADATVSCWDGTQVDSAAQCTRPRGADGLAWVFPSFDRGALDCVDELVRHPEYNRPEMWTCEQTVGGRPVSVTYSEVSGRRQALRFLDRLHGEAARAGRSADGRTAVHTWPPTREADGRWLASLLLRHAPFAVTVSATLRDDAVTTLQRRVRIHPAVERRGP